MALTANVDCRRVLRSQRGESLVEVLVAMLIASLSMLMLASAIAVSRSIVEKTKDVRDDYVSATNTLMEGAGTTNGTVTVTDPLNTPASAQNVTITSSSDLPGNRVGVTYKYDGSGGA